MRRILLFVFVITGMLVSCQEPKSSNNVNTSVHDSLSLDTIKQKDSITHPLISVIKKDTLVNDSSVSCMGLLTKLIKTSSFNPALQKLNYNVRVDEVTNGVISIELTTRNTEMNQDNALSWIEMDTSRNELRDVTVDPDKPIQLKYDTSLFKKIVVHCKW
jgi:hypothetical protein